MIPVREPGHSETSELSLDGRGGGRLKRRLCGTASDTVGARSKPLDQSPPALGLDHLLNVKKRKKKSATRRGGVLVLSLKAFVFLSSRRFQLKHY